MYIKGKTTLRTLYLAQLESQEAQADYDCAQMYPESVEDKYNRYAAMMTAKNAKQ
jgi:hypothetical protein